MSDNYADLTRDQLINLLRKRDLSRRLGLVWERDEIEHERGLTANLPLLGLVPELSKGSVNQNGFTSPWNNLLIEGDNFQALRFMGSAYKGQVKCIYIDPPYNTGTKDFIYNDRFQNKEDSFFNSTWLEFLYRRLSLARELLREDGVLLVSINDDNRAYLELLLDQIWPGGRQGSLVWRSRIGDNSGKGANLSVNHEHILVWANPGFRFRGSDKTYDMYDGEDDGGSFRISDLTQPKNISERRNSFYPIYNPDTDIWYPPNPERVWAFASETKLEEGQTTRKDTMEELVRQKRIIFPKKSEYVIWNTFEELLADIRAGKGPKGGNKNQLIREDISLIDLSFWVGKKIGFGIPAYKRYASDMDETTQPLSSWIKPASDDEFTSDADAVHIESGFTDEGSKEIRRLLGDKAFNYPKPPSLLHNLIAQSTGPDDLVLDFFAGSGTTAQAVAQLNKEDGGKRNCILVSTTEANADEPDKNICRDVTARRLSALGIEFAYLRVSTWPTFEQGRGLADEVIWSSLQLLVAQNVTAMPDENAAVWTRETDQAVLCFARRLDATTIAEIEKIEAQQSKTVLVFSFQPGPIRQRLMGKPGFRVEALPDALNRALLPATTTGGAL
jgi:adenine-specific DNA-methyltransferase